MPVRNLGNGIVWRRVNIARTCGKRYTRGEKPRATTRYRTIAAGNDGFPEFFLGNRVFGESSSTVSLSGITNVTQKSVTMT